jgi:Flp pilus assembly protein TadB
MAEDHEMPRKMGAMRSGNTVLVLRSIMAVLVGALAIAALANGRIGIGLLLAALAITNVVLTVTMYRRRAELRRQFGDRFGGARQSAGA